MGSIREVLATKACQEKARRPQCQKSQNHKIENQQLKVSSSVGRHSVRSELNRLEWHEGSAALDSETIGAFFRPYLLMIWI